METEREKKNAAITVIRWSARVLEVIFVGVFLLFALGEGTPGNSGGPLQAIWFGLLGIYAVAMLLALKWERAAVPVAVAALLAAHVNGLFGLFLGLFEYPGHALINVVNPILLAFWVPVLLYLLCWRLEGRGRRKSVL